MSELTKDFVERVWGKPVSKEEMEGLLWQCTAFPCVDVEELEIQLTKVKLESGGDFNLAMKQADEAIRRSMADMIGPPFEETTQKVPTEEPTTLKPPQ